MKKFVSILLALVLCFSLSVTAFAADPVSTATTVTANISNFYTVTGDVTPTTVEVPGETIYFDVAVREGVTNPDDTMITALPLTVNESSTSQNVQFSLPVFDTPGIYKYEVSVKPGTVQGVTYATNKIYVDLYVVYNDDKTALTPTLVVSTTGESKSDQFTNLYDLGHLTVTKTVSGNLADRTAEFYIDITLTSDNPVLTDIYYDADTTQIAIAGMTATADDTNQTNTFSTDGSGWTLGADGKYTATVTVKLSADGVAHLYNIPAGVTYAVVEQAQHILQSGETFDPNSAADKQYTVSYTNEAGSIAKDETDSVIVTNTKNTDVPTGVTVDSIPYVVMLVVVAAAAVLFLNKRRNAEY